MPDKPYLRLRGEKDPFTGDPSGVSGRLQVFDPSTQKSFSYVSAKGKELLGATPGTKASASRMERQKVQGTPGEQPIEFGLTSQQPTQEAQSLPGTEGQLLELSESYQTALSNLNKILGEQRDVFQQQLEATEKETGMKLDLSNEMIGREIQAAMQEGTGDFSEVIKRNLTPQNTAQQIEGLQVLADQAVEAGLDPEIAQEAVDAANRGVPLQPLMEFLQQQTQAPVAAEGEAVGESPTDISNEAPENTNPSIGYDVNTTPEVTLPTSELVGNALDSVTSLDSNSILSTLAGYGLDMSNMSSSEMLQVMLLQQGLSVAEDPTVSNFLMQQAGRATSTFETAMQAYENKISEMDKILSGEEVVPTSYESLAAKAYKQASGLQMESVEAEKDWLTTQYDVWSGQERDKRGRLEGYLKAKLYASGAQDSSAGLAAMALSVNAADLNMQLKQGEYQYAMSKLNIESRSIMSNFTNNVVKLGLDAENAKEFAQSSFDEKMFEIEGMLIADEREKDKMKLEALSGFTDKMYQIDQDKKAQARWEYEKSYQQIRDKVDDAYKLSGQMGTVHFIDPETGEVTDSGVPTFDREKWEATNWLETAKYEQNVYNDSWNMSMDLLEGGMYEAAAMAIGEDPGFFYGFETLEERKFALEEAKAASTLGNSLFPFMVGDGSAITTMYSDGSHGGQCGDFIHKFFDIPSMGNSLQNKIDNLINTPNGYTPNVGDIVVTNEHPTYGHVAIVNAISPDGTMTLTESNYVGNEIVSNYRTINTGSPKIMGYHTGDLKPDIKNAMNSGAVVGNVEAQDVLNQFNSVALSLSENTREFAQSNFNNLVASGDIEGAKNYIDSIAYSSMGDARKEDFNMYGMVMQGVEDSNNIIDSFQGTKIDLWKNIIEQKKPLVKLKKDPEWLDITSTIESMQAQFRRAMFGTAITDTEMVSAQKFLIYDDDDMSSILIKLDNMADWSNKVRQRMLNEEKGVFDYNTNIVNNAPVYEDPLGLLSGDIAPQGMTELEDAAYAASSLANLMKSIF